MSLSTEQCSARFSYELQKKNKALEVGWFGGGGIGALESDLSTELRCFHLVYEMKVITKPTAISMLLIK